MRGLFTCCLGLLLALSVTLSARADIVPDLHSARVPVADQGSRALDAGARAAMAQVLVKVSGSDELLQSPVIVAALAEARGQVQQYAYIRGESPEEGLSARFEFDPGYITQLVASAGAPLWTANRPVVLAWIVVEDETGRHFVNEDSQPALSRSLVEAFAQRGVPLQLPLFDLVDTAAVRPADVWRREAGVLQAASARYKVENVVAGRVTTLGTGKLLGDWSYFYLDERFDRSVSAADSAAFWREGVNIVAREMAGRYAVAPTGDGDVLLSVTGVQAYADYAGIARWLESLEPIEHANIERVQGERVEFRLGARADAAQLAAIIELNERLVPVSAVPTASGLNYQWRN